MAATSGMQWQAAATHVSAVEVLVEHAPGQRGATHVPELQGDTLLLGQPDALQVELHTRGVRMHRAEAVLAVPTAYRRLSAGGRNRASETAARLALTLRLEHKFVHE